MNEAEAAALKSQVRVAQIIFAALMFGLVAFAGVALGVGALREANAPADGPAGPFSLTLICLALGIAELPLAFFVPFAITQAGLKRIASGQSFGMPRRNAPALSRETESLLQLCMTTSIVRAALFEGAALAGTVAYLVERQPLALAGTGLGLLLLAVFFPTVGAWQAWLIRQREMLELLATAPRQS